VATVSFRTMFSTRFDQSRFDDARAENGDDAV
jgi:hypothetical protein